MIEITEILQTDRLPDHARVCVKANLAAWRNLGYEVKESWDAKGPLPYVQLLTDDPDMLAKYPIDEIKDEFFIGGHKGIDHLYRLQGNLHTLYISEPYWTALELDYLSLMQRKVGQTWRLVIGSLPLWYPGKTVQLIFWRNIS